MEMESYPADQVDEVLGNLFAGSSVLLVHICSWLMVADRNQQWLADGAADPGQWLSARFGIRHSTAGQQVRVARRLQDFPVLSEMFSAGELSLDQVDAISKIATPGTETSLIEELLGLSNAALDRAARRANPPTSDDERTAWERRWLYIQHSLDGVEGHMSARMPGAELEMVEEVLRERADQVPMNPETGRFDPYPARLVDGLVELCSTTGDETSRPIQMTIHADLDALGETTSTGVAEIELGPVIASETARRLGCDSILEMAVYSDRCVLGVGRRSRTIPGWLRGQLCHRDGSCRFPGCGRTNWLHGHHIKHWADGGTTDLHNLLLLCGYHHRFLHEHGWRIEGDPGGRLSFMKPDGSEYPPGPVPLDPRLAHLVRST
jgi:hypothetical protein